MPKPPKNQTYITTTNNNTTDATWKMAAKQFDDMAASAKEVSAAIHMWQWSGEWKIVEPFEPPTVSQPETVTEDIADELPAKRWM